MAIQWTNSVAPRVFMHVQSKGVMDSIQRSNAPVPREIDYKETKERRMLGLVIDPLIQIFAKMTCQ